MIDEVIKDKKENENEAVKVGKLDNKRTKIFDGDMIFVSDTEQKLQHNVNTLEEELRKRNMKINEDNRR